MPTYRRNFVAGGCYFLTVNLAGRRLRLLTDHVDLLRAAFRYAPRRASHGGIPRGERVSGSRLRKRERGVWQRRYWEHTLRDEDDFARHVDYIHFNPVKHGHVERVGAWPFSSFHRLVRLGVYPETWAGDPNENETGFDER